MSTGKIIAIIGVLLLIAGGIWAAYPLVYNKEVNEALPVATEGEAMLAGEAGDVDVMSQGMFSGSDQFHQAEGTARIVEVDGKKYVRFESDFSVTNGPDLFVHFGKDGKYAAEANLGKLKGNIGAQNYEIPSDIDVTAYDEVWIWCRAFSVPFGTAVLQ